MKHSQTTKTRGKYLILFVEDTGKSRSSSPNHSSLKNPDGIAIVDKNDKQENEFKKHLTNGNEPSNRHLGESCPESNPHTS